MYQQEFTTMTNQDVVNMVGDLASELLGANDARMAAAEDAFRQATGLQVTDDTDAALGALFTSYAAIWEQATTAAFWAGYNQALQCRP